MGLVYTDIKIRNPFANLPAIDITAKVDSGAALLVLPRSVAKDFNLPVIRRQKVKPEGHYADERVAERDIVGVIEVEVCGRKGWFEAVVGPRKKYALLGAVVMESLDLIVEPRDRAIRPNPRSDLPMAEIE